MEISKKDASIKLHRIKRAFGGGASRVLQAIFCFSFKMQNETYQQIDSNEAMSNNSEEMEDEIHEVTTRKHKDWGFEEDGPLPILPGEIIIMIVRALPNETAHDLRYIKSLSTISPLFRTATQTVLFRHVTTRPFHSFAFQASFIYSCPHIANQIRVLCILPRAVTGYNLSWRLSEFVTEPHPNSQLDLQKAAAVRLYHLISACPMLEEIRLLFCGEGNGGLISDFSQRGMMKAFAAVLGRVKLRKLKKIVLWKCDQNIAEILVGYDEQNEGGFTFTTRERFEDSIGHEPKHGDATEENPSTSAGTVHWHVRKPPAVEVPFSKTMLEGNLARVETMDVVNWIPQARRYSGPGKVRYSTRELGKINDGGFPLDEIQREPTEQSIANLTEDSIILDFIRVSARICHKPIHMEPNTAMHVTSLSLTYLPLGKEAARLFRCSEVSRQLRKLELSRITLEMSTFDGMRPDTSPGSANIRWCEIFDILKTQAKRLEEVSLRILGYNCFNRCHTSSLLCLGKEGWQDDEKKVRELLTEVDLRNKNRGISFEDDLKVENLTICMKHGSSAQ